LSQKDILPWISASESQTVTKIDGDLTVANAPDRRTDKDTQRNKLKLRLWTNHAHEHANWRVHTTVQTCTYHLHMQIHAQKLYISAQKSTRLQPATCKMRTYF